MAGAVAELRNWYIGLRKVRVLGLITDKKVNILHRYRHPLPALKTKAHGGRIAPAGSVAVKKEKSSYLQAMSQFLVASCISKHHNLPYSPKLWHLYDMVDISSDVM